VRIIRWLIPLTLVAIALGPARRLPSRLRQMAPERVVPTLQVEPDTFVVGVVGEQQLQGCDDTPVKAGDVRGSGQKLVYLCADGIQVKADDVIARLDTTDLQRTVDTARVDQSKAQAEVAQRERQAGSEVETARNALEKAQRELEIMQKSNATELETAKQELEHKRMLEESARLECERKRRLAASEIGLVSRQDLEQAERSLRSAAFARSVADKALALMQQNQAAQVKGKQDEIASAQFKLTTAEAAQKPGGERGRDMLLAANKRLERALRDLEGATLKAPVAGTLVIGNTWDNDARTLRPFKVGDVIWGGQQVATITNLSRLEVAVPIEETAIAPLKVGQEADLTFDAVPGKHYRGKVASITPSARRVDSWENPNLKPGARYFMARITLLRPDSKLRPGLQCKARIVLKRLRNVLAVPLSAVVKRDGADLVFVRRSSRLAPQRVTTGDRSEEAVVITKGLRAGDIIALEDPTAPALSRAEGAVEE